MGVIRICGGLAQGSVRLIGSARVVDVPRAAEPSGLVMAASDTKIIGQLRNIAERVGDGNWLTVRIVSKGHAVAERVSKGGQVPFSS